MSWIKHHKVSENLASQAQAALNERRREEAQQLYAQAARAEDKALAELDKSKARTLGITAVSAVSLYYKATEFERAIEVALQWLKYDSLPAFADEQLRNLLRTVSTLQMQWAGPDGPIGAYVRTESERALAAYRSQPSRVDEDANQEQDTARGGYARRQIVELVQNASDQLTKAGGGRIGILLTATHLYVADNGCPIDEPGARAMMFSHLSPKRGTDEIGRFGVGFKSVLGVTDSPGFFSRSGSFVFDRESVARRIRDVVPNADRYPVLRIAEPVDPHVSATDDQKLASMMRWAMNVVRLPLKGGAYDILVEQIRDFRAEFLFFVPHVKQLDFVLTDDDTLDRFLRLDEEDGQHILDDNGDLSRWKIISLSHPLSTDAQSDRRTLDNAEHVTVKWAAPFDRQSKHHHFWAFFPTQTTSLISGIFNAPWKTNEDRQNLLPGIYNEELIDTTARLVADSISSLHTQEDPARHLDVLGGRAEYSLNNYATRLAHTVYSELNGREVVPDLSSSLRILEDVSIPPDLGIGDQKSAESILDLWAGYEHRPQNWLHRSAVTTNRLATIARIYHRSGVQSSVPRTSIPQWLEALTGAGDAAGDAVRASATAIQIAAFLPENVRTQNGVGAIVLTAANRWVNPERDTVYLGDGLGSTPPTRVHPEIESDQKTVGALKKLGVTPLTPESKIRNLASAMLDVGAEEAEQDARWYEFWALARSIAQHDAIETISRRNVRVLTKCGSWRKIREVLLPGPIVPDDGTRDARIAVDTIFHEQDIDLLEQFGARKQPVSGYQDDDRHDNIYLEQCRTSYYEFLKKSPHWNKLRFDHPSKIGPLDVFEYLSPEGQCRFTESLLCLDDAYRKWVMHHESQRQYPRLDYNSLAVWLLLKYGCVRTPDGIYELSDGLGEKPKNADVQRWLLKHPKTLRIREAFPDLKSSFGGDVEPVGSDDPIPLTDEWPGLGNLVHPEDASILVRCDRLAKGDGRDAPTDCTRIGNFIYLVRQRNEELELRAILREIDLEVDSDRFTQILQRETPSDIRAERQKIREKSTDAERLLAAVGEEALRERLPPSLARILDQEPEPFTDVRVAEAAIATYHTGSLREYKRCLHRLSPPTQWAGGRAAVTFVRELGFGVEWAGRRELKPPPYEDVGGPYKLPPAHNYQKIAIANVRGLLRAPSFGRENRGLLSLPTGSGKTRVAVEAIIDAVREDGFDGTVLWMADREELCEQAVESWRQAWSAIGPEGGQLRVSRMWGGRRQPVATDGTQVIVATRQTLAARGITGANGDNPLNDVRLLVVDEAHGSIAPSYTSIMGELGLTFRRREDEICLLGLTATPYRGRDKEETQRLVNRYGQNRLDSGAFHSDKAEDVIRELQDMTVLSSVNHRTIEGSYLGLDDLNEHELYQFTENILPWLPESIEHLIANDAGRTRRIVDAYKSQIQSIDPSCPTLIFATSVEHAETIAALLKLDNVEARAISGKTDEAVRRSVVERFRAGDVTVLVNYGVFREGFDAPKTRAIIVARPVYSPNLYFQMIGRGLRGELNGGSERCLILDVEDNIENYDRALAFSALDWLWS